MKFYQVKDLKYAKEIYNLNNSSFVRKHSENSKHFSYKNHLSWMNKLINSKNNRAFVYISKKFNWFY